LICDFSELLFAQNKKKLDNEFITFVGIQDEKDIVTIVIHDAISNFRGLLSDPNPNQGEFSASSSFTSQKVLDIFDSDGIYNATAFTNNQK
jgi:hypothetical protein|tara:strand:- start:913 stop:1185 length:273 start_codon:yes stop_codon:yes gene_type:complete